VDLFCGWDASIPDSAVGGGGMRNSGPGSGGELFGETSGRGEKESPHRITASKFWQGVVEEALCRRTEVSIKEVQKSRQKKGCVKQMRKTANTHYFHLQVGREEWIMRGILVGGRVEEASVLGGIVRGHRGTEGRDIKSLSAGLRLLLRYTLGAQGERNPAEV